MGVIHVAGDSTAQGGGGFNLTPVGTYDLRINSKDTKPGATADKFPYTQCHCTVMAADNGKALGQAAEVFLSHSPKSAGIVRQFLEQAGIGFVEVPGPQGVGIQFDDDHLVGAYIRGKCTHREWNGQMRENWGNWEVSRLNQQGQTGQVGPAGQQVQVAPPQQQLQAAPQAAPPTQQQGVAPPVAQGFYPPQGQQG